MYKVIVIDDEMLVRRGIVMETDWQALNCVVVGGGGLHSPMEKVHWTT